MSEEYDYNLECEEDENDDRFLLRTMTRYLVQLVKLEPCDLGKGPSFKWHFLVKSGKKYNSEDSAKGLTVQHLTSRKLTPSLKLWKFVQNMLGRTLKVGEKINPGQLINGHYVIIVDHNPNKGKTYNRITSIEKYEKKA